MKRKFVGRLKEYKRDILPQQQATDFSIFHFSNPDCRIYFENAKIQINSKNVIEGFHKESIEMMTRSNKVCNVNTIFMFML